MANYNSNSRTTRNQSINFDESYDLESNSDQNSLVIRENEDLFDTDYSNCADEVIVERRQCWLCLNQEEIYSMLSPGPSTSSGRSHSSANHPTDEWLSPCRCKGTAKWIHNECLQLWIDEKQKLDTNVSVKCAQCDTQYVIVFPPNGKLLDIIQWYESTVNNVSKYAMVLCITGAVYLSAMSYGLITCIQVIGAEKCIELVEHSNAFIPLVALPSIPFVLCAGKLINWETMVLRLWRRYYHRIPLISFLTGSPAESGVRNSTERNLLGSDNAIQVERNNGVINHIEINISGASICRAFCGALLLPTFAKFVGQTLYDNIESDLNKTLLGGLTFIAIKGGLKIYLRQQQFIRQTKRRILNYCEFEDIFENNN